MHDSGIRTIYFFLDEDPPGRTEYFTGLVFTTTKTSVVWN